MQQGVYAAPCDVKPNRDRADINRLMAIEQRLWIIEFSVKNMGKGCAVVKAYSPKEAERLLRSEGILNGTPSLYDITRIEEIVSSPDSMLIAEQIATTGSN